MGRSLLSLSTALLLAVGLAGPGRAQEPEPRFSIRSADGAFQLKLRGYVQADGRFWTGDEERSATDTFLLRRIRPIVEGTVFKIFDFRIMPDFGEGRTVLQDGYVEARFSKYVKLRAGKYKAPFGLERLQSGTDILFVERALPTNLVPNRDLGVQISGDVDAGGLSYAVGVFNGVPDGGSADVDGDDGKDVVGRLFVQPFKEGPAGLQGLGFGIAASTGSPEGTPSAPGLPAYRTQGQQTFFSYRADGTAAGTTIADGSRTRFSPQGSYYAGPFGLLAEYVRSEQEVRRAADAAEIASDSWQVAASYVLTGDRPSYRAVSPKKVFDPAAGTWGAFELAARYSVLDIDEAAFPLFANPASAAREAAAWGLGVNWYLNRNVRLFANYEVTEFEGGRATDDREDEKVFLSRFQISF